MSGQWEIYTTGGGIFLRDVFNFIAAFTSGPGYDALLTTAVTVGVLGFAYKLMWGEGIRELFKWFIIMPIISIFFVAVKTTVVIIDRTKSDLPVAIVDNVPYGIAVLGNLTSSLGHDTVKIMEPLLSTPDDLAYQKAGMFFGAGLVAQSTRWETTDSIFRTSLMSYLKRCGLDGANIGLVDLDELTTSGDLVQTLQNTAPNSLAFYNEFSGSTVTCADGIGDLMTEMDDYIDHVLISQSNKLFADNQYETSLQKVNRITGSMDGMLSMLNTSAATSRNMLAQSMLVQALDDAAQGYIADSGNSAAMQHYQTARADRQTISSYQASAAQARKWVPMLKILMEIVYYAFFPIAVALMLTPMAFTIMKSYASGFLWLAMWEPINAIMHFVVIRRSASYYQEAGLMTEPDGTTQWAMTFSNHIGIRAVEADVATLAGHMISMTPFLAFALIYGAQKLASASTSMTNVGQSAAIETGRETATGNHNLANVSANNYNANKMNTSSSIDTGRETEVLGSGATRTRNADGVTTYSTGTAGSNFLMGASMTSSLRESASASYQQAQSQVQSARAEESQSYERAASTYNEMFERSSMSGSMTDSGGRSYSEEQRATVSEAREKVEQLGQQHNLNSDLALKAGLGVSLPLANASGNMTAQTQDNYSRALNTAERNGITEDLARVESFRQDSGWQSSEEFQLGDNYGSRDLFNEANSARMSRSNAEDNLKRAEETHSRVHSSDASTRADFGNRLQHYAMNERGMSEQDMLRVLNPQTPEAQQDASRLTDDFVSDMVAGKLGNYGSVSTPSRAGLGTVNLATGQIQNEYNTARDGLSSQHVQNTAMSNSPVGRISDRRGEHDANVIRHANHRRGEGDVAASQIDSQIDRNASNVDNNNLVKQFVTEGMETWEATGGQVVDAMFGARNREETPLSETDRDNVIRTIIGEAAREGEEGWGAVANVIQNRVQDSRFGDNASDVVLAHKQFSAWNSGAGGNSLVHTAQPGSKIYEDIGQVVDRVFSGQGADPTFGATHYYSPAGMQKLVNDGDQSNVTPNWLSEENSRRGTPSVQIGGHIFSGRSDFVPQERTTGFENSTRNAPGSQSLTWPKG